MRSTPPGKPASLRVFTSKPFTAPPPLTPPAECVSSTSSLPASTSGWTTARTAAMSSGRPVSGSCVPPTLGMATTSVSYPLLRSRSANGAKALVSCHAPGTMTMVGLAGDIVGYSAILTLWCLGIAVSLLRCQSSTVVARSGGAEQTRVVVSCFPNLRMWAPFPMVPLCSPELLNSSPGPEVVSRLGSSPAIFFRPPEAYSSAVADGDSRFPEA